LRASARSYPGCVFLDNLIVIRYRDPVSGELLTYVQELSVEERKLLRRNPLLLKRPAEVLMELAGTQPELDASMDKPRPELESGG
jgi:hypothetical protein